MQLKTKQVRYKNLNVNAFSNNHIEYKSNDDKNKT